MCIRDRLLLRGVPKNDNYYPAKGIMPRKEILEILRSVYLDKSEEELLNMMEIIKLFLVLLLHKVYHLKNILDLSIL